MNTNKNSADDIEVLSQLLVSTENLLLDFDGPICSVFSGVPAQSIAARLRVVLANCGHVKLPPQVRKSEDPFEIFRFAATLGIDEAQKVEVALMANEIHAVATAEPTRGVRDLILRWHSSGRSISIVSNNSEKAIKLYLNKHGLSYAVSFVSARSRADPSILKPAPSLVSRAVTALRAKPMSCTLVGDSVTDVQAALSSSVGIIGYAIRQGK